MQSELEAVQREALQLGEQVQSFQHGVRNMEAAITHTTQESERCHCIEAVRCYFSLLHRLLEGIDRPSQHHAPELTWLVQELVRARSALAEKEQEAALAAQHVQQLRSSLAQMRQLRPLINGSDGRQLALELKASRCVLVYANRFLFCTPEKGALDSERDLA